MVTMAGLPKLTIHGLRHTRATILMEKGVSPKVASERLGPCQACNNDGYILPCVARYTGKSGPGDKRDTSTKIDWVQIWYKPAKQKSQDLANDFGYSCVRS